MMNVVYVEQKNAEKMKEYLKEKNLILDEVRAIRKDDKIGFAVNILEKNRLQDSLSGIKVPYSIEEESITATKKAKSIEQILEPMLGENIRHLKKSFDIIGSIAIIEESEELKGYEKEIAEAIMTVNRSIKSVYIKEGIHQGEFRIQPLKHILGEKSTLTEHHENGYRLMLDVQKTYFSPRLSSERMRIASAVEKGENVLVLFSGIAPYGIALAKHSEPEKVYCVELNKEAHEHAIINAAKNKCKNIICINEDAKEACKEMHAQGMSFERIIMPLPKNAGDFLEYVLMVSEEGTTIHLYTFAQEEEIPEGPVNIVKQKLEGKADFEILLVHRVGQYAPRKYRVCVDFRISKIKSQDRGA